MLPTSTTRHCRPLSLCCCCCFNSYLFVRWFFFFFFFPPISRPRVFASVFYTLEKVRLVIGSLLDGCCVRLQRHLHLSRLPLALLRCLREPFLLFIILMYSRALRMRRFPTHSVPAPLCDAVLFFIFDFSRPNFQPQTSLSLSLFHVTISPYTCAQKCPVGFSLSLSPSLLSAALCRVHYSIFRSWPASQRYSYYSFGGLPILLLSSCQKKQNWRSCVVPFRFVSFFFFCDKKPNNNISRMPSCRIIGTAKSR